MEDLELNYFISKMHDFKNSIQLNNLLAEIKEKLSYSSCGLVEIDAFNNQDKKYVGIFSKQLQSWLVSRKNVLSLDDMSLYQHRYFANDMNEDNGSFLIFKISNQGERRVFLFLEFTSHSESYVKKLSYLWLPICILISRSLAGRQQRDNISLLTNRERECMFWISQGKTSWEVSVILGISERTVNFHVQNCIRKTNSINRQQALYNYTISSVMN